MNRILNRNTIFVLGLIATSFVARSQHTDIPGAIEKVILVSDRTLYIAGEKVHFSASLTSTDATISGQSQIIYAEIISPDGRQQVGVKLPVIHQVATGCLAIPEETITGIYYLRAYTKYMRNEGPSTYSYIILKIVNPYTDNVSSGNDVLTLTEEKDENIIASNTFNLSSDKIEYAPHEKVSVDITGGPASSSPESRSEIISIAVVPGSTTSANRPSLPINAHQVKVSDYLPETRGVSVTGEVLDSVSSTPVAAARINLSIIGQGRDFMATPTDSAGRFFFSLPAYTGYRDLFLCVERESGSSMQLLVDNDFCSVPLHLPFPEFKLTEDERAAAYAMALNTHVQKFFRPDSLLCRDAVQMLNSPFYGKPSDIIIFDHYIQLPTLEDYFDEFSYVTKVKKRNGHRYFKVIGTQPEMDYYDPLVLVDLVAVNNPEKILSASPTDIERIETVNVPYVKGNVTYGGIVSIISKRGDFAGIDLPSSGIFVNYLFNSETCSCQVSEPDSPDDPDGRNTLYWNPDLAFDANGHANFAFTTPDTPGKYVIVLNRLDRDGHIYSQKMDIVVKGTE